MSPPYEIRLIVNPQAEGYRAVWTSPQGQLSEAFPLTLPLQPDDMAKLRWYLETYVQFPGAGDRARAQRLEAQLVEWGENLFDALFGMAEGVQVYNDLMNAERPRLLTLGSNDPAVPVPDRRRTDQRFLMRNRAIRTRHKFLYLTRAEQTNDPAGRTAWLRQAVASVEQSLAITLEMQNQVFASSSYFHLGVLHRLLSELEQAEQYARQALQIRESLDLPDVYQD